MGLFGIGKSKDKSGKTSNAKKPEKVKKSKLHTRRKVDSVIAKMQIQASVPATIIDAIDGDSKVLNNENDFLRLDKVTIDGKTYYPVFIFDDDSLKACGLADKSNANNLGQLSAGLKSSSGSTGFLPVATPESLSDHFFGLMPMHDAFEVLMSIEAIKDYKDGWLAGLLNIDGDVITLEKTDLRLTMPQWWEFVNSELSFKVVNNKLALDLDVPTRSDDFALSDDELGDDEDKLSQAMSNVVGEFDDDDQPGSNSVIDNYLNSGNDVDGYEIPSIDDTISDNENNVVQHKVDMTLPDESDVDEKPVVVDTPKEPVKTTQPLKPEPEVKQSSDAPFKNASSMDALDAQNTVNSNSIASLNDLGVSISDKSFVDAYINTLGIEQFPMLDDSNDPTGRIRHVNMMRQQANMELKGLLSDCRASLLRWFESERAGLLDALKQSVHSDKSELNNYHKRLNSLQDKLANQSELRKLALASVDNELTDITDDFEKRKRMARESALIQVEQQFNDELDRLQRKKESIIDSEIANQRQILGSQLVDAKKDLVDAVQMSAEVGYQQLMSNGQTEFRNAQKALQSKRAELVNKFELDEKQARSEENRRVADQADVARNDVTIANLKDQLSQMETRYKQAMDDATARNKANIETIQAQATRSQQEAVSRVQADLDKATKDRDAFEVKAQDIQAKYEAKLDERDDRHRQELESLRNEIKDAQAKSDASVKRVRNTMIAGMVGVLILGGAGGFVTGELFGVKHTQSTQTQQPQSTQQPIIIQSPAQSSSTSESSSSHTESSSSQNQDASQTSSSEQSQQGETSSAESSQVQ